MGARPAEQPFDPRTASLIKSKVRKLLGTNGFTRDDEPDLRQEISMHVVKGLKLHDPSRSSPRTFAARIIQSKVASIVRQATAAKRDRSRIGEDFSVEQLEAREGTGDETRDLLDAVRHGLSQLPPQTRAVATLLMEFGQLEVARRLGLTRQQVRTECMRIAEHFRDMGLEENLRVSNQPL